METYKCSICIYVTVENQCGMGSLTKKTITCDKIGRKKDINKVIC
uniref:Uncharacterized protein n=1 Tax=Lepeophtheirus salmonis TaxID=72036 RepID=A0A0K2TGM3_LEPSM